ncbi:hypothetical protein Salat_1645900 [Sesamum alatum]|uniref:Uncharacterized protein n=1 Tax=Sesamum alatum TaxID=300844 RepID=A0AAE1Y6C3_9LAMI|nr:hypothetical protein Salat_1645900 [Sesamum alatum]
MSLGDANKYPLRQYSEIFLENFYANSSTLVKIILPAKPLSSRRDGELERLRFTRGSSPLEAATSSGGSCLKVKRPPRSGDASPRGRSASRGARPRYPYRGLELGGHTPSPTGTSTPVNRRPL